MSQEQLASMLDTLKNTLIDIVTQPDACVADYPLELKSVLEAPRKRQRPTVNGDAPQPDRDFTANECILRDVFAEVSKIPVERIGLTTPLYALGLDSVAAIQISARCRKQGLPILVADVFQGETVMGICAVFEERGRALNGASEAAVDRVLVAPDARDAALRLLSVAEEDVEDVFPVLAVRSALVRGEELFIDGIYRARTTIWHLGWRLEGRSTSPSACIRRMALWTPREWNRPGVHCSRGIASSGLHSPRRLPRLLFRSS